eukprot:CAMPEP_0185617770 /NCGR_PEP_ID=MMETSP0436-20130131/44680_1 /TAXON_ID=626734 ORGANISM="Favella taraikaensis, Strain Fe Narragansett Bay" /NCGR_SAMPLE_ID=MMETSP0436 /ASSEMBLY_ACC=CAM_ASM_000390 /LENGTH=70 /DNA_ID=CAMNT_0028255729 /DNA_START=417 /DNA_END=629 /DNA_ORIENTATION=+
MTEVALCHTLSHCIFSKEQKTPSFADKLQIAIQIAQTVHFLHQSELGTFHRDLKADNVLVKTAGDSARGV